MYSTSQKLAIADAPRSATRFGEEHAKSTFQNFNINISSCVRSARDGFCLHPRPLIRASYFVLSFCLIRGWLPTGCKPSPSMVILADCVTVFQSCEYQCYGTNILSSCCLTCFYEMEPSRNRSNAGSSKGWTYRAC